MNNPSLVDLAIDALTDEIDRLWEIAWTPWTAREFERLFAARRALINQIRTCTSLCVVNPVTGQTLHSIACVHHDPETCSSCVENINE